VQYPVSGKSLLYCTLGKTVAQLIDAPKPLVRYTPTGVDFGVRTFRCSAATLWSPCPPWLNVSLPGTLGIFEADYEERKTGDCTKRATKERDGAVPKVFRGRNLA